MDTSIRTRDRRFTVRPARTANLAIHHALPHIYAIGAQTGQKKLQAQPARRSPPKFLPAIASVLV
jgi:hypothetical protein